MLFDGLFGFGINMIAFTNSRICLAEGMAWELTNILKSASD